MTWQDELQHLDAELAAGRISAEEYRQRRDALLSQGGGPNGPNSGGFAQPNTPSGGFAQPGTPSGGFAQQQDPFPPAFSWGEAAAQAQQQAGPPQGTGAEPTQMVNQPPWPQQPQQWNQAAWPTPGTEQEPNIQHGDTSWLRQGPEVFDNAGKSGKGKLIAGISIGAVLVVVAVVAGIFFFTSSDGSDTQAQESSQQAQPTETSSLPEPPAPKAPPANSEQALAPISGTPHPWNGALDVPALQGARGGLLQPQQVRDFAIQSGLIDGHFLGTEGTPKITVLALQLPDESTASSVVREYLDAQQGLSEVEDLSYQGVKVVNAGSTFRTAYTAHSWAVIIDVSGPEGQQQAVQQEFQTVLDNQLEHLPPTVRE